MCNEQSHELNLTIWWPIKKVDTYLGIQLIVYGTTEVKNAVSNVQNPRREL